MAEHRILYAILRAMAWDSLTVGHLTIGTPDEGPHYFIPVFNTRDDAEAWRGDMDAEIVELLSPVRYGDD